MDPTEALNHPLRRQILRTLIASDRELSPSELVAATNGTSVSLVSYHAKVLATAGAVGYTPAGGADEGEVRYHAAPPNPETLALLEATRDEDAPPPG